MKRRLMAMVLSVLMVMSVLPISVVPVAAETAVARPTTTVVHNTNQGDGIILAKFAQPHLDGSGNPDGTVDIVVQAHTTGKVTQENRVVPTDIALVLDLSGSMDDLQGRVVRTDYSAVNAQAIQYGQRTYYGFNSNQDMYIDVDGTYTRVRSVGFDRNGFQYYYYGYGSNAVRVYPELSVTPSASREHDDYDVVQFYTRTTTVVDEGTPKIDLLKEAVDEFIDGTAAHNATLTDEADMHRIALIKFASDEYYNSSDLIAPGNETFWDGGNEYNYSQVLADFTTVNTAGAATLKGTMDDEDLKPGGATAVDYGMNLADFLFAKQEETEAADGRNRVVIVFTDGTPTHASAYDSSVAGAAINHAKALKDEGVVIYTIGVQDGADASELGDDNTNRFLHYLSSNYPSASYSNGSISAGEGSASAGYYLTPDDSHSLSMIFEEINEEIGEPTIELGTEAVLVDTVSEFFTISEPNGTNSITVATADRKSDGTWTTAVESLTLTPTVVGNKVTVKGFDFDSNYVSDEPRTVDGEDFYGRMLILTINVTPNYTTIDTHKDDIAAANGLVDTNYGDAEITKAGTSIAKVASPEIKLNTVTYNVDNDEYATYYRLAGSEITVLDEPAKTGYTFSGWSSDDVDDEDIENGKFTMPEKDVTIKGTFDAIDYTVSYKIIGADFGVTAPGSSTANYQDNVVVKGAPDNIPAGYTFYGWYPQDEALGTGILTEFSMPAHDVVLLGRLIPNDSTVYKVEHWFETLEDGVFGKLNDDETAYVANLVETRAGTTGETATAHPLTEGIEGFTFAEKYDDGKGTKTVMSGTIAGDGSLVLKLYYTRNSYKVTYDYEGTVPDGASEKPAEREYKYGETVTIADKAYVENDSTYEFHGWYLNDSQHDTTITEFTMPARDVLILGHFEKKESVEYKVEHWFENIDDEYYTLDDTRTETLKGLQGEEVTAIPLSNIEGFTFNDDESNQGPHTIPTDGTTLIIKLYYNRNSYKVEYNYDGTVIPDTAESKRPAEEWYKYGQEVTVADKVEISGYTFTGWYHNDSNNTPIASGSTFDMPAHDVDLRGYFKADINNYTVAHYVQTDNGYVLHGEKEIRSGATDAQVTAISHLIPGYTYSADETAKYLGKNEFVPNTDRTIIEGTVKEDNSLEIAFYYTRNPHKVIYVIEGAILPENVQTRTEETVEYGTSVDVDYSYQNIAGYTFNGWSTNDIDDAEGEFTGLGYVTNFTMPDHDVVLRGSFTAVNAEYTINYWHQSLDGSHYDLHEQVTGLEAITGHYVSAYPDYVKTYEGFKLNPDNDEYDGYVKGDGSLELNLYYDRLTYDVTYIYVGSMPSDAPEIPASYNKTAVIYGTVLDVEDKMEDYSDRKFDGWHSADVNIVGVDTYTMPAKNVIIYGRYVPANPNDYEIRYYINNVLHATYTVKPGEVHDIIDAPSVSGVFSGWSDPVDEDGAKVYVASNSFIMPWSDVEIRASVTNPFIPILIKGTLSITKVVDAPEGFTGGDEYTFDIYSVDGEDKTLEKTVTVKAGQTIDVKLSAGEYLVVEKDAAVEGYILKTSCDDTDATVTVSKSEDAALTFTNTYTKEMLEKDDHFGYIIGYPDGTVRPEANITRAEVVTIFFRMLTDEARNEYWSLTNKFTDVAPEDWYNTAISTLANAGVLDGYTDGTFHPNDTITRAELIKIATSFSATSAGEDSEFSDIEAHWAETFIEEAHKLGIVDGYGDGTFHPDQAVTRAEAMKIVNRTLERAPHKDKLLDSMIEWPDNADTTKWYYAEVQEATNSHDYDWDGEYETWTGIRPMRDWAALELVWHEKNDDE